MLNPEQNKVYSKLPKNRTFLSVTIFHFIFKNVSWLIEGVQLPFPIIKTSNKFNNAN